MPSVLTDRLACMHRWAINREMDILRENQKEILGIKKLLKMN